MAEVVSQRITNELTRLYAAVNEVANRAVVTSDDIQYFINCLEHFHRHLLRLSESGFVTAHCVRILQDALSGLRDSGIPEDLIPAPGSNMHLYREKPLGRPKYFLSRDQLEFLLSLGFNKTQLSEMLGMSARTIQRRMAEYGLSSNNYSDLSEEELDRMVTEIKEQFPRAGYRQVLAILKSHGVFVREHELRDSVQRCDPLGTSLRWFATIERRQYSVRGPLELWHVDGNHKLIRWRMVLHGAIDGYSLFLPRVNRHLDIWKGGWNNHSMRTAGSLSPLQQFVSGMLQLRGSGLEVAKEMFCQVDEAKVSSYGIDWDGPIPNESSPSDDFEIVEIPNIEVNVREEQQQQLSLLVDPLSDSDCYGIDLYIQARNFLHSLT
ncbi:unnamed protein product [Porites evermanni]|uniref:Uncharacterized protein n=1 Tax=Porites evermanni TaxID=104178 RepID=A0ABN8SJY6_9CNID|nr:unnamed protein product [Porites evermanni]